MSVVDKRNWDDYYHSFSQAFKYLDEDLTDPNRFPRGKILFDLYCVRYSIHMQCSFAVVCKVFYKFVLGNIIIDVTY